MPLEGSCKFTEGVLRCREERVELGQRRLVEAPCTGCGSLEPGEDGWKALRGAVFEARWRSDRPDGSIRFDDAEERGRTVILSPSIADAGYQELVDGHLPTSGYYVWDPDRNAWRRH